MLTEGLTCSGRIQSSIQSLTLRLNRNRYKTHSEAVIIACYGNPRNNPYRLLAFQKWYRTIKHLPHRIIECTVGDAAPQLRNIPDVIQLRTGSLLWHKETLLNKIVAGLPKRYKYIFWVDADVIFTNNNWVVDGVRALQSSAIIQPFEYCVHLERNQLKPAFNVDAFKKHATDDKLRHKLMWRSFCANVAARRAASSNGIPRCLFAYQSNDYDVHGHVGFAWAARREVLEACPLYDSALIGGADHIIAHAAAGQFQHQCITKSFTDNLAEIAEWEKKFYAAVQANSESTRTAIGYVPGDLYHIWHGEFTRRQYLKRIQDSTKHLKGLDRDENGLHVKNGKNAYFKKYFKHREADAVCFDNEFDCFFDLDDQAAFIEDMGYAFLDLMDTFGKSTYDDSDIQYDDIPSVGDFEAEAVLATQQEVSEERVMTDQDTQGDWQLPAEAMDVFDVPAEDPDQGFTPAPEAEIDDAPADALCPENVAFDNGDTFTTDTNDSSNFS